MLITLIIAQTFGLFCAVLATVMFVSKHRLCTMLSKLSPDHAGLLAFSLVTLIIGTLLLVVHCHWHNLISASVSLIGAVLIIASVMWLTIPGIMVDLAHRIAGEGYYLAYSVLIMFVGLYYLICGLAPVWQLT